MSAYEVSYRRFHNSTEPTSTNLVYAESYEDVQREFDDYDWYAASIAPEWKVKECRAKGMPERWLQDD